MNVTQQQQQQQPQRSSGSGGGAPYYIGCGISLISKSGIRYEGTLYAIDPTASTVALQNVRSFGSEGRRKEGQIPASNNVYEYIIFRGSDIKHLEVCEPPRQNTQQPPNDPAIINVQQGGHSAQNMGYPKQPNMFYPPQAMNMYHPYNYNNPYAMYNQYYPYGPNPQVGNPNLPRGPQQGFPPNPNDLPQGSGAENGEESDKKEQNGDDEVNGETNEDSEKTENNETAGDEEENANETEKREGLSGTAGDGSSSVVTTGSAGSAGSVPSTSIKRDETSKDNSNANVNNNSYGYANKERREQRDESGRSQGYQRGGGREGDYQRRGLNKNMRGQQNRNVYRGSNGRGAAGLRKSGGRGEKISEFDFEKSHSLFDFGQFKEELKQSGVPMGSAPPTEVDEGSGGEEPAPAVNVTKAYNKNESFFDNLSSDSGEGKTRTSFAEQRKVDVETFGQVHLGDRGRRRYTSQKRGQSQNYGNTNNTGGGRGGRGGHTGRGGYAGSGAGNHGSGQGNTKKVFVPVNSSNGTTKNTSREK